MTLGRHSGHRFVSLTFLAMLLAASWQPSVATASTGLGGITGKVVDAGGVGLAGMRVDLGWKIGAPGGPASMRPPNVSSGDGTFEFAGLQPGDYYVVSVRDLTDSYATQWWQGRPDAFSADGIAVTADTTRSVEVTLPVGAVIVGTVRRQSTGEVLPGTWVQVEYSYDGRNVVRSGAPADAGGCYVVRGLPPLGYRVRAGDPAFQYRGVACPSSPGSVTVSPGTTATIDAVMIKNPVTTSNIDNAWHRGLSFDVTFTVTPGDLPVIGTQVRIGTGTWAPVSGGTVRVSGEGTTDVTYASNDASSYVGPYGSGVVKLDASPPTSTCNADGGQHASFQMSATDKWSGVAHMYYQLDGGPTREYTAPVPLAPGTHWVTCWSEDLVGNTESPRGGSIATGIPVSVYRPLGPGRVWSRHWIRYRGYLRQRVRNGSAARLETYLLVGGAWVKQGEYRAKIYTPRRRGRSRYSGRVYFSSPGRWMVIAVFEGDERYAPGASAGKRVKAR